MKKRRGNNKDLNERILEKSKQYVEENDVESEENDDQGKKRKSTEADLKVKREKNRIKKLGKRQQKRGVIPSEAEHKGKELAITYLQLWRDYRDIWKFQKARQIWLLKHMFDVEEVVDSHFETLLQYLVSVKGNARQRTLQQAESLIKKYDDEGESKTEGKDAQIYARAREVVQLVV